jgi:hypothetical protein
MDLIEFDIYALKLYKKEERVKTGLYPDFNDIFIYNLEYRRLTLKKETSTSIYLIILVRVLIYLLINLFITL